MTRLFSQFKIFQLGTDEVPSAFRTKKYSTQTLDHALSDQRCVDPFIYGNEAPYKTNIINFEQLQELKKRWLGEIISHPIIYLKNRLVIWFSLIGYGFSSCRTKHFYFQNEFGHQFNIATQIQRLFTNWIDFADQNSLLMKVWFWLILDILALLIIEFANITRFQRISTIPLSAIFYTIGYFPITQCCDFRYVWIVPIMAYFSLILAISSYLNFKLISKKSSKMNGPD